MLYPFMTLNDGTEIVHSEMKPDGKVKVYIEKPDAKLGMQRAGCQSINGKIYLNFLKMI
jgi:hypothetical protein